MVTVFGAYAALTAACAGTESAAYSGTEMRTAGDTLVAYTRGDVPTDQVRTFAVDWRVGEDDDPATSFASITSVAVGPDGRVLVWDSRTPALRLYGADGELIANIGRVGAGPGEYDRLNGIAIRPDSRLLAWDSGNSRLNVYAADGTHETSWRLPVRGFGTTNALSADDSGRAWLRINVWTEDRSSTRDAWLRLDSAGSVIDTILAPQMEGADPSLSARQGGSSSVYSLPYGRSVIVGIASSGTLLWGLNRAYSFHAMAGGRLLRVEREWTPVALTDAQRAQARRGVEQGLRMTQPSWTWNGPEVPDDNPPYTGLTGGLDGRIWVRLSVESEEYELDPPRPGDTTSQRTAFRDKDQRWDVFESDGRYLGRVSAPRHITPMVFQGNHAWGSMRDDDDVPTLVKLRVAPPL